MVSSPKPALMITLERRFPARLPAEQRREHAHGRRRRSTAGLERAVSEHHLEVGGTHHHPAKGDLLQSLTRPSRRNTFKFDKLPIE